MSFDGCNMSLLEAKHITKEYDGRTIIKDISIYLEEGELISLLGLSGSGKTTLFQVLSGLTRPETGKVFLNGREITGKPGAVSYMLQKDLLLPHKKVIDNVSLPLVLKGMKKRDAREAASPFFAEFGLEGYQDQYPDRMSGGMRQRAAFLRTYLSTMVQTGSMPGRAAAGLTGSDPGSSGSDPAMHGAALLDEPFSALDTITKGQLHTWYLEMMQRIHLSTIFITHDIDEAILLSDRIYLMTARPGVIEHEIRILPPRDRRKDFNLTQEFLDYKKQIIHILGSSEPLESA